LEGMTAAVSDHGPFCDACFSGRYTAPLVDVERGFIPGNHPAEGVTSQGDA